MVIEQSVFEVLHRVVQALDRVEVPVDDDVKQSVHQGADPVVEQIGVGLPPS